MDTTEVKKSYLFEEHFQRIAYDGNATVWFKDLPSGEEYCRKPLELSEGKHGDSTLFAPIGTLMMHTQDGWKEVSKIQVGDVLTNPEKNLNRRK